MSFFPGGISSMDVRAPSLVCPSDDAMTSTANVAVASTASGLAPRSGFTSTMSMTDSRPAHQDDDKLDSKARQSKTFKKSRKDLRK